jgi:hypothetical protein
MEDYYYDEYNPDESKNCEINYSFFKELNILSPDLLNDNEWHQEYYIIYNSYKLEELNL